ncbi:FAD-binding protein [Candidatus Solirubrobacter pratensis]|uniref:FAD-binding protein n=1 Tax=Candidatus Solirubrobacter pratensis TaxID=1298857 RepID=UPI000424FCFF|nr:FAD-binding protein [Candidatus Solirubrobacter pratensis]
MPSILEGMNLPEIEGRAVLPGDAAWDEARRSWNLAVDQRPAAVVEAAGPADVQALLRAGVRVAPQATGHGSELLGPLDDVVLLKTSRLREVSMSGAVLRAGAGALAGAAADAASAHGRAPVLGLAAGVGVAGLALGGGTGWLSRAYGLACNNVRAFDAVLASGEAVRVDAAHEPELFWALRGGGGRGAVVTAIELETHPVDVSAGMLTWPAERAAEVLEQFRRWTSDAPEALGAVFRRIALPDGPIVAVVAAHLGTEADGRRALEPLRGAMVSDSFGPVAPADLVRVAGDPEQPIPTRGDGFLLRELDVEALAAVLEDPEPIGVVEVRLLGGALRRAPDGHGALGSLDAAYSIFCGGMAVDGLPERLAEVRERLAPWASPQELLTAAARGADPARAFGADWERLERVRREYDPDARIVTTHDLAPVG